MYHESEKMPKVLENDELFEPQVSTLGQLDASTDDVEEISALQKSTDSLTISSPYEKVPVIGLHNLGNTCFYNSTLQVFTHRLVL